MEVRFHKRVHADLKEILGKYYDISHQLGEDFFAELQIGVSKAVANPRRFYFDRSGLRRCNLDRFPYHFLYDISGEFIRVWVFGTIGEIQIMGRSDSRVSSSEQRSCRKRRARPVWIATTFPI